MDMVLIPNFNEENGKRIINQNEEKIYFTNVNIWSNRITKNYF